MNPAFQQAKDNLLSVIAEMFNVPCNEIDANDITDVVDLANELLNTAQYQDDRVAMCSL